MKKIFLLGLFSVMSLGAWAQFSGSGSGTENDPYLIFNPIQMDQVRNFLGQDSVFFKLMSNVDMTEYIADNYPSQGFQPIGTASQPFKGVFDGNGKTVSGLWINRTSTNYVGLWGYLSSATVKNLTVNYNGDCKGGNYTGSFVGESESSAITGCTVNVTQIIGGTMTGGFAGEIQGGTVSDGTVVFTSIISSANNVGGFVGCYSASANLTTCSATGNVQGTATVGGFAGWCNTGTVTSSSCKGNVSGSSSSIGGFVGAISDNWGKSISSATLSNCSAQGNVSGSTWGVGGFVGNDMGTTTCTSCTHFGTIKGSTKVGGFAGNSQHPTYTNCGHEGDITATGNYASGLVGKLKVFKGGQYAINRCYAVGNLTALGNGVGGIVGGGDLIVTWQDYTPYDGTYCFNSNNNSSIYGSKGSYSRVRNQGKEHWNRSVSEYYTYRYSNEYYEEGDINTYPGYIIVGRTHYKDHYNIYNRKWDSEGDWGTADRYTLEYCYSIVFIGTTRTQNISICNNYYNGIITANDSVGGVIGTINGRWINIDITKNYSNGNISGHNIVGGVLGYFNNNLYATGTSLDIKSNVAINPEIATVEGNIGRVYGMANGKNYTIGASGTTERNYALTTTKVSVNGVPQTIEDNLQNGDSRGSSTLKIKGTYQGIGWDFTNDWTIQDTECYPYSPSQTAPPVFSSKLISGMTQIKGNAAAGSEVLVNVAGTDYMATVSGTTWNVTVSPLESGTIVYVCAREEGKAFSYRTSTTVGFAGSGTAADPYQIYTASDLAHINSADYYKLMNNIDLTSYINTNSPTKGWVPVGRSATVMSHLLGDGHTITGLWSNTTEGYTGLFAAISNAEISDLTVIVDEGKTLKGGDCTGILAGKLTNGKLSRCIVRGNVSGSEDVGGIVGNVVNAVLDSLDYKGQVTISGEKAFVGGIVGNCAFTKISNSVADVVITANGTSTYSYMGGMAGTMISASGRSFEKCKVNLSLTTTHNGAYVGGLAGSATEDSSADQATCVNSLAKVQISATGTSCYGGGLFGYSNLAISSCCASGSVVANGSGSYAGGLVGLSDNDVMDCYSTADVTGSEYAAGLVGYSTYPVARCYASGNLKGANVGAGVVGYNDGTKATINNCVAINNVIEVTSSTGIAMRVLGGYKNNAPDPTTNNYAYKSMAVSVNEVPQKVYDDLLNGIAKTTDQLMQQSLYSGLGWDFNEVWGIEEGTGYPYLLMEIEKPAFITGDVTGDGKVTVADAAGAVSIILGESISGLNHEAADVTGDKIVSVADVAGIVNIILDGDNAVVKTSKRFASPFVQPLSMNMTEEGLSVMLSSEDEEFTAIQFDVTLPQGVSISVDEDNLANVECSYRTTKHIASAKQLEDGIWRVVCYSLQNKGMKGTEGEILYLPLTNVTDGSEIEIQNIELVRTNLSVMHPTNIVATFSETTGINSLSGEKNAMVIYNLNGQRTQQLVKGINIVNGNKVIIK